MSIALSLGLLILSLIVGIAAVGGDTWRPVGLHWHNRLTVRGWITVLCLGLTVVVSLAKDVISNRESADLGDALKATRSHAEHLSTQLEVARRELEAVNRSISDVQSRVSAGCTSPPCWTAEQAVRELLGSTKDYVDRKTGGAPKRTPAGWEYVLDDCEILVHYAQDVVIYFSFPLVSRCPASWREQFELENASLSRRVSVGDLLEALFAVEYPPQLHIATGCTNCGNWHDPYIEFRIPGPHVIDFLDRYFTVAFDDEDNPNPYDKISRFEQLLRQAYGYEPEGTMNEYCGLDVLPSVSRSLRDVEIERVGFGRRGWSGRANYPLDICNVGYTAG